MRFLVRQDDTQSRSSTDSKGATDTTVPQACLAYKSRFPPLSIAQLRLPDDDPKVVELIRAAGALKPHNEELASIRM